MPPVTGAQPTDHLSPQALAAYRRTADRRQAAAAARRHQRLERGRALARQAAVMLRCDFKVDRVAVFGSLLRPEHFDEHSDVDLAVWGLAEEDFLRAVAAVTSLDREITVDLVAVEQTTESLRHHIEEEGEEI